MAMMSEGVTDQRQERILTDVFLTNLFGDFDVGTIDGTDQQATVQAELHVAGSRGLSTGGGDMLANIRGRDQQLGHCEVRRVNWAS
jgi:hypothetical protein